MRGQASGFRPTWVRFIPYSIKCCLYFCIRLVLALLTVIPYLRYCFNLPVFSWHLMAYGHRAEIAEMVSSRACSIREKWEAF